MRIVLNRPLVVICTLLCLFSCKNRPSNTHSHVPTPTSDEQRVEPKFEGIDSIVNLSFLGIGLNQSASQVATGRIKNREFDVIVPIKTRTVTKSLVLDKKSYPISLSFNSVNDSICSIYGEIDTDIFTQLKDTYVAKYGNPSFSYSNNNAIAEWEFRNQKIRIHREKPQRVIWHPELQKNIYTHYYDFKYVSISYSDYALCAQYDSLLAIQKEYDRFQKAQRDSIEEVRQIEASQKAERERQKKLQEDARLL